MATCDPPRALSWLASRRTRLVLTVLAILVGGVVGASVVPSGWLGVLTWLAGSWAAVTVVLHLDRWRYGRFLARTDQAWIASLAGCAGAASREALREAHERLESGWLRAGRWRLLPEACGACIAWMDAGHLPAGDRRELLVVLCEAVRAGAGRMPDADAWLIRLRDRLLVLDRGVVNPWSAEDP